MTSLYRRIYKAITLMAAPAMLWTAYEMYVLTLNGQQMLFFSITHAFPIFAIFVACSALLFLIWSGVTVLTIIHMHFRDAVGLWRSLALASVVFQAFHILNLIFYDGWSGVRTMSVFICAVGIFYVTSISAILLVWLLVPQKQYKFIE